MPRQRASNKILKSIAVFLAYAIGGIIGAFLLLNLGLKFLLGDFLESCAVTPKVEYAKSIPQNRLENLYYQIEKISSELDSTYDLKYENIKYPQISDINFSFIRKHSEDKVHMMLGGCVDNKVFMYFEGLKVSSTEQALRKITLSWGEYPQVEETLWKKKINH